jgi:hypothetical protein
MRKRHAARPMLESVEDRLALSTSGALDPTSQVRATIAGLLAHHSHASPAQANHHATTHGTKSEAHKVHQHTAKTTHHPQQHSSSSSSSTNSFSNFLKSVFPGL